MNKDKGLYTQQNMLLLASLIPFTSTIVHAITDGQCDLPGLCDGTFVAATLAEDKSACIHFCRETPLCSWFSLDTSTHICLALEDCPMVDSSRTNTTSGSKDCPEFTCSRSESCEGTVVSADPANNANSCLRLCQANQQCSWFTFLPDSNVCVQLQDCPNFLPCSSCVSGQQECSAEGAGNWNKIMVGKKNFELLDLSTNNATNGNCNLPEYPFPVSETAAMIYDEEARLVRACGGLIPSKITHATNRCFTFDGFQWREDMEPIKDAFYYSGSLPESFIVHDIGWWILSCDYGFASHGCRAKYMKSELFTQEQTWIPGPEVPYYNTSLGLTFPSHRCSVQLNSSHTMVTGGQLDSTSDGSAIPNVWLFDWNRGEWSQGPSLALGRRDHNCLALGAGRVMVAGGKGLFAEDLVTVEVFDETLWGWYASQDLPEEQSSVSTLVLWNDDPVWLNGDHSWHFKDGEWVRLNSAPTQRDWRLAVPVPDDFIPSC